MAVKWSARVSRLSTFISQTGAGRGIGSAFGYIFLSRTIVTQDTRGYKESTNPQNGIFAILMIKY
jgi:hypothetical protein